MATGVSKGRGALKYQKVTAAALGPLSVCRSRVRAPRGDVQTRRTNFGGHVDGAVRILSEAEKLSSSRATRPAATCEGSTGSFSTVSGRIFHHLRTANLGHVACQNLTDPRPYFANLEHWQRLDMWHVFRTLTGAK